MMRYQRVSPDYLALPNGRKPSSIRACKDDGADTSGRISNYSSPFEAKPLRVRSESGSAIPSPTRTQDLLPSTSGSLTSENAKPHSNGSHETSERCLATGDVVLQWGHNKRSRGSRAENRAVGDDASVHSRQVNKIQRRAAIAGAVKIAAAAAAMPPPWAGGYTRGTNLRACSTPLRDSNATHHSSRNTMMEERSGGQSRSEKGSPSSTTEKAHHKAAPVNMFRPDPSCWTNPQPSDQDTGSGGGAQTVGAEKLNLEQLEWPRIYISLSRKEKEDDFMAMKGTKLPQRPKKRSKNIDKALQFCFPGMWLSDLSRGRYEVREKKCARKKRRGLKGMESMDSDSE